MSHHQSFFFRRNAGQRVEPLWMILGFVLISAGVLGASMETFNEFEVDFTNAEAVGQKAEWSDGVNLTKVGLGFDGDTAQSRRGWILTRPVALGTAWRPATRGVTVSIKVSPAPQPVKMTNGSSYTPYGGIMYARFGCDRKHWSNWQELERNVPAKDAANLEFHGIIGVPARNRTHYDALHAEYRKQDVAWVDDEEALARWIAERETDFFVKEQPYVGYVQFLYEVDFNGGQRLQTLKITVAAGIGGMHQAPKDPAEYGKHEGPWRYAAP